jgi:hypothetical protein
MQPVYQPFGAVEGVRGRYGRLMEEIDVGSLVVVDFEKWQSDGIVFELPSDAKAVVAVIDNKRGPVLRSVPRTALTERTDPSDDDRALELLIRRTAPASRGSARSGGKVGGPQDAHARGAAHRPTGR